MAGRPETPAPSSYIFDCNVWIEIILQDMRQVFQTFLEKHWDLLITSYNVVEILRVLKRVAKRTNVTFDRLENLAWNFWTQPCIRLMFDKPLSENLIREIQNVPEYRIIAKAFDLEPKDVPYIVAAFQYNATLVTRDRRSLVSHAPILHERLDVRVISWSSLLDTIHLG